MSVYRHGNRIVIDWTSRIRYTSIGLVFKQAIQSSLQREISYEESLYKVLCLAVSHILSNDPPISKEDSTEWSATQSTIIESKAPKSTSRSLGLSPNGLENLVVNIIPILVDMQS